MELEAIPLSIASYLFGILFKAKRTLALAIRTAPQVMATELMIILMVTMIRLTKTMSAMKKPEKF